MIRYPECEIRHPMIDSRLLMYMFTFNLCCLKLNIYIKFHLTQWHLTLNYCEGHCFQVNIVAVLSKPRISWIFINWVFNLKWEYITLWSIFHPNHWVPLVKLQIYCEETNPLISNSLFYCFKTSYLSMTS